MPSTCTPIVFPGTLCRSDLMANFVAQILGLERLYRHLMRNHRIPLEKSTNTPLKFNVAGENQTHGKGDYYNWKPPFLETMLDLGSLGSEKIPPWVRENGIEILKPLVGQSAFICFPTYSRGSEGTPERAKKQGASPKQIRSTMDFQRLF